MMTTTLKEIEAMSPCESGWATLLAGLGKTAADDEPLTFLFILDNNGIYDFLWSLRCAKRYKDKVAQFALDCVRMLQAHSKDERVIRATDGFQSYLNKEITIEELAALKEQVLYARSEASKGWDCFLIRDSSAYKEKRNEYCVANIVIWLIESEVESGWEIGWVVRSVMQSRLIPNLDHKLRAKIVEAFS